MGTRTLFMNGITVTVPRDTVLEFFYSSDIRKPMRKVARAIASKRVVEFGIGGLLFRTKAEIVEEFPESTFATKLLELPVKKDGVTKIVLDGLEFESPELFPMIFDFLLRRFTFNAATQPRHIPALRTAELSPRQSTLLDAIEKAVFGVEIGDDSFEQEELTGPKYYIRSSTVYVAKPPPGVGALPEMCADPLMVHLVMDRPVSKKARPSDHGKLVEDLKRRYALEEIDFGSWDIVEILRGVPFVFREGAEGLEVVVKGCESRAWDLEDAFRVRVA